MSLLSICIPAYEANKSGTILLKRNFDILINQSFKDFEIIISDHSKNNEIKNLCEEYKNKLNIKYYKNTEGYGNCSINMNNAIKNAKGKLIKILFQDDFLYTNESLQEIINNFNLEKDIWLVTESINSKDGNTFFNHTHPRYNKNIQYGKNTLGSPSILTIKNENPLLFDENLIWLMDCDYYKKCYDKFGEPKILNKINVVIGIGPHQITNTLATKSLRLKEFLYVIWKYL